MFASPLLKKASFSLCGLPEDAGLTISSTNRASLSARLAMIRSKSNKDADDNSKLSSLESGIQDVQSQIKAALTRVRSEKLKKISIMPRVGLARLGSGKSPRMMRRFGSHKQEMMTPRNKDEFETDDEEDDSPRPMPRSFSAKVSSTFSSSFSKKPPTSDSNSSAEEVLSHPWTSSGLKRSSNSKDGLNHRNPLTRSNMSDLHEMSASLEEAVAELGTSILGDASCPALPSQINALRAKIQKSKGTEEEEVGRPTVSRQRTNPEWFSGINQEMSTMMRDLSMIKSGTKGIRSPSFKESGDPIIRPSATPLALNRAGTFSVSRSTRSASVTESHIASSSSSSSCAGQAPMIRKRAGSVAQARLPTGPLNRSGTWCPSRQPHNPSPAPVAGPPRPLLGAMHKDAEFVWKSTPVFGGLDKKLEKGRSMRVDKKTQNQQWFEGMVNDLERIQCRLDNAAKKKAKAIGN